MAIVENPNTEISIVGVCIHTFDFDYGQTQCNSLKCPFWVLFPLGFYSFVRTMDVLCLKSPLYIMLEEEFFFFFRHDHFTFTRRNDAELYRFNGFLFSSRFG